MAGYGSIVTVIRHLDSHTLVVNPFTGRDGRAQWRPRTGTRNRHLDNEFVIEAGEHRIDRDDDGRPVLARTAARPTPSATSHNSPRRGSANAVTGYVVAVAALVTHRVEACVGTGGLAFGLEDTIGPFLDERGRLDKAK